MKRDLSWTSTRNAPPDQDTATVTGDSPCVIALVTSSDVSSTAVSTVSSSMTEPSTTARPRAGCPPTPLFHALMTRFTCSRAADEAAGLARSCTVLVHVSLRVAARGAAQVSSLAQVSAEASGAVTLIADSLTGGTYSECPCDC